MGTDDDDGGDGPFGIILLEGEATGLEAALGGNGDGMLRITLSCRSTNDSLGAG